MPTQDFNDIADWLAWVEHNIVTNGAELITGDFGNITENAAIKFISQSPLNWQKAKVRSLTTPLSVSIPVNVFIATPASLTWTDNIYNQYVFINTTLGDIPLLSGTYFYDINIQPVDFLPAKSIVNIMKASNDLWIVSSVPYSGSNAAAAPLVGTVGDGGADDPVANQPVFQSNRLIGLGSTNNGKIKIELDDVILSNFGINSSFVFNYVTGEIDMTPNDFITGSGLYINLNQ